MLNTTNLAVILFLLTAGQTWAQRWNRVVKDSDSLRFSSNQILVTVDSIYFTHTDTLVILKKGDRYRLRTNPYAKSTAFYDSLEVKSYRNRISRELYHLLVKSTPVEVQDTSQFYKGELAFQEYQGLKIRSIRIKRVDVIGGSVFDTLVTSRSLVVKAANKIHTGTRPKVISNYLTIREGEFIDAIQLADNERILRNSPYIEDARIYVNKTDSTVNFADLLILIKDRFSYGIGLDYSSFEKYSVHLYNKNFLGIGHEMRLHYLYNHSSETKSGYSFRYQVNNISNSRISARLDIENSWRRELKSISFHKEFLTWQTRYAGGISMYEMAGFREKSVEGVLVQTPYRTFNQDYWIGRAFQQDQGKTINLNVRYARADFSERPVVTNDSNLFYRNRGILLAGFSFVNLNYYKGSLIYSFGITEDIPYGYKLQLIAGSEKNEFDKQFYIGTVLSLGKYAKFPGYMFFNSELGSFYNHGFTRDMVVKLKLINIGNLHRLGRYSIRIFTDIDFQSGENMSDPDSRAVINGHWNSIVSGLNREGLRGQRKLTLSFENALFTPWYVLGFKFSVFAGADFGWLWNTDNTGSRLSFYNSLGAGIKIKNESWVFETIKLGIAFLTSAPPGSGKWGMIFNGSDPAFLRSLNPGKPEVIRMDQEPVLFLD